MENKKKSNKKFMIPLFVVLALGVALAGVYVVNHVQFKSDVYEPFTVEYAVLGDASNYVSGTCAEATNWMTLTDENPIDMEGLYAGESRKLCVKITNAGEADVPYVVTGSVEQGLGNYEDCALAFPEVVKTGTANPGVNYVGQEFTVPTDAPVVNDCVLDVSVGRGELD